MIIGYAEREWLAQIHPEDQNQSHSNPSQPI